MSTYTYYGDPWSASRDRVTWAVRQLILINAAVFVVQLLIDIPLGASLLGGYGAEPPGGVVQSLLAFQPSAFLVGGVWKPFTYLFLHGGLMHLFWNMLWLFFFGPDVEHALGSRQFIRFYLLCGALGVLATFIPVVFRGDRMTVVGASGAVMGVLVAYAMLNPERELFLFPLPFPINARALVLIVIAMNIVSGLQGGGTSVATHLGGMAVGALYMKFFPVIRRWWRGQVRRPAQPKRDPMDTLGEAVDNIFKFENRKRRD